ncbi:MAG: hypothetical protein HY614_08325 [Candidatus Rokubacteria bacterium]|nr:hypothetical protein [Candidatus Rokubacteria bacterium]
MRPTSVASAALLAALAVVVGWLGWRSLAWPLVHDAPIMHYIAWRVGGGAVPYRDLFDMNFPGVYLVHLAVVRGLGPGDLAWRAFDLAWLALTALGVAALAAPWGVVAAAGGALFFALYHLAGGAWQAGQRDYLLCLFLLAGALGVARWLERARGAGNLLWGGLALGAGITIKPHAAVFAGALGVAIAVGARRAGVGVLAPVAAFAAAAMVAPLAVVVWLGALGALPAWRAIVVDYLLPLYSRLGRPSAWGFHRWPVWIPIAVAVLASVLSAARHRRFGARHAVAALGLAYGVAHYVGQGKGWEYHVYPLAAFAAVVLFSEVEPLLRARRLVALPLVASLVAVIMLLGAKGAEAVDAAWIKERERRVSAVVADLGPRLRAGERVQVLDTTEGGIHALLRLRAAPPTRFLYDFHFFHDVEHPVIRALRAEFVRQLDARPPRFVVVFRQGWPAGGYERLARFPELAERLDRDYRAAVPGDGYVIYAKRDDS